MIATKPETYRMVNGKPVAARPVLAWRFLASHRKLNHDDGREVKVGEKLTVDLPVILCARGLHACVNPVNALYYMGRASSNGLVACRVKLTGEIVGGSGGLDRWGNRSYQNKHAASERTVLGMTDATPVFIEFVADRLEHQLNDYGVTEQAAWDVIQMLYDIAYGKCRKQIKGRNALIDKLGEVIRVRKRSVPGQFRQYITMQSVCWHARQILNGQNQIQSFDSPSDKALLRAMLLEAMNLPGPEVVR